MSPCPGIFFATARFDPPGPGRPGRGGRPLLVVVLLVRVQGLVSAAPLPPSAVVVLFVVVVAVAAAAAPAPAVAVAAAVVPVRGFGSVAAAFLLT